MTLSDVVQGLVLKAAMFKLRTQSFLDEIGIDEDKFGIVSGDGRVWTSSLK